MRIIVPLALFMIIFSAAAFAFTMSSEKYKITGIISDGGDKIANVSYSAYLAVGQPIPTVPTDPTVPDPDNGYMKMPMGGGYPYKICIGVFCTGLFDTPHYVEIGGVIRYDTGEPVSNGDAKVIVKYGGASYEAKTRTGDGGQFSAKVLVPEEVANINFMAEVYAKGKVEAVYECLYNQTSGYCESLR